MDKSCILTSIDSLKRTNEIKKTINYLFLSVNNSKYDYILSGNNTRQYAENRVRDFDGLKTKTIQSILPDSESAKQHIRRGNLQC